jgi:RNase P/RNase MRP subunit p30
MDFILVRENDFVKARNAIGKNRGKKIVFSSDDDELNRKILEKLGESLTIDCLLINQNRRKDGQKQRDSGFNQVMAKSAKKNSVCIGINLDEITENRGKDKSRILARIQQNIKLCNKNKLKMKFINLKKENERNIYDLKSLGLVLGMPTWMIGEL